MSFFDIFVMLDVMTKSYQVQIKLKFGAPISPSTH